MSKSRFQGPVVTRWHKGSYKSRPFEVYKDVVYRTDVAGGHDLLIPKGYRGDGLSVPWIFTKLFSRTGKGRLASLPHDVLCDEDIRPDWCVDHHCAADVFDEALKNEEVPPLKRKLMVWAVRHYGPKWGPEEQGDKPNGKKAPIGLKGSR